MNEQDGLLFGKPGGEEKRAAYKKAYRAAHREELLAKERTYQAAHPEVRKAYSVAHREELRAYAKIYRAAHLEEARTSNRAYYVEHREEWRTHRVAHREEITAHRKAYLAAHREKITAHRKAYLVAHREEIAVRTRAYRAAHREERNKKNKAYNAVHREEQWIRWLKNNHGLTIIDFKALLDGQGGVCAICGKVGWGAKGPNIDHNHATGKIRAVLCANCNLAVGLIHDDPRAARAMASYLEKFNGAAEAGK